MIAAEGFVGGDSGRGGAGRHGTAEAYRHGRAQEGPAEVPAPTFLNKTLDAT